MINEGKVDAQADRVNAIIAEWTEKKPQMDAPEIKRFNQMFFKVQDMKKPEPEVPTEATGPRSKYDALLRRR